MKPLLRNTTLLFLNAAIWSLNGLVVSGTLKLSAKGGVPVSIKSDPERIRLLVNSKPWPSSDNDAGWIQTPMTINLPEGQHKMLIERPGYVSHNFRIVTTPGDNPQINADLETTAETFVETSIVTDGDALDNLNVIVDSGLAIGNPPLDIYDLTPGNHILELRWQGLEGLRKKPTRCMFKAAVVAGNNTLKIVISKSGKKIKISGCKRI